MTDMVRPTTDMGKLEDFMTTKEAAKVLGLTQRRILQAIKETRLEAVRMGGRWLVKRESVYRYKESK